MADVFISYKSNDRDRVAPIAEALARRGLSVWWDPQLDTGVRYADHISAQLDAAKAVIVVWSEEAAQSDWVREEADRARQAEKLVPVRIDGVRLPPPFNQFQCADLSHWDGHTGQSWERTLARVEQLARGAPCLPPRPRTGSLSPVINSSRGSIALSEVASIEPIPRFFRSANALRWLFKFVAGPANIILGFVMAAMLIGAPNATQAYSQFQGLGLPDFRAMLGILFWPAYVSAWLLICALLIGNVARVYGGFSKDLGLFCSIAALLLFGVWVNANTHASFEYDGRTLNVLEEIGPYLGCVFPAMLAAMLAPNILEALSRKDVKIQTKQGVLVWRNLPDQVAADLVREFEHFRRC